MTKKQREHRLRFAKNHEDWYVEDWWRVLWSDETLFELHHPPNHHNDRVWAVSGSEVPSVSAVKHPTKVHVWGMISHRAMSQLHVVLQKTVISGEYYRRNILTNERLDAISRTAQDGGVLQRSLIADTSQAICMQGEAPPHTAQKT